MKDSKIIFEIDGSNIIIENEEAYFVSQDYCSRVENWEFEDIWRNRYRVIGDKLYKLEWKEVGVKV